MAKGRARQGWKKTKGRTTKNVQSQEEIAEADLPSITALEVGREVLLPAEVEVDQEVTACLSAPTTSAEVTRKAATKARKNRK